VRSSWLSASSSSISTDTSSVGTCSSQYPPHPLTRASGLRGTAVLLPATSKRMLWACHALADLGAARCVEQECECEHIVRAHRVAKSLPMDPRTHPSIPSHEPTYNNISRDSVPPSSC